MTGYDESNVWVDEPITEVQSAIVAALGFGPPERWAPGIWTCGAFADDGTPVVIRDLPYLPDVNATLKAVGFRWDADQKEWHGEDRTKAQVEVLQALSYCAQRYYNEAREAPKWAVKCGTGAICPVRVGAYS
jgi:hypothetical protein